jgi:magnesium transporter
MEGELSHQKQIASLIGPDLQRLLKEVHDPELARELVEDFHPEDLADLLKELDDADAAEILKALPDDLAAPIFERLEEPAQSVIVEILGPEEAADLAAEMSPDDRADLLEALPEDVGEKLLDALEKVDPEAAREVETLGRFPEGTAGALMTTDYLSVRPLATVADAIAMIRKKGAEAETIYYVFVANEAGRLEGVASLRDLLLAEPHERIAEIMTSRVIAVHPETDQEEVARRMSKYDLLALPVVDRYQTIIGVITADDIMDVLTQEGTEDVQKLGGMEALDTPYMQTSMRAMIKKRAGWLSALFLGEMLTASAMGHYEEAIAKAVVLALFVPLIISSGGNSGSQATTLIIRAMALGEVTTKDWWRIIRRELTAGLALGLILATIGTIRILVWQRIFHAYGDHYGQVAATVAVSLIGVVTWGTLAGSMLPFVIRRLGFDPASASAPFVATLVDVCGLVIYFNVAQVLLRGSLL